MLEDRTTQNTLATFIGAYVYATVGIVLRETRVLTDTHAFLIFYLTVWGHGDNCCLYRAYFKTRKFS